MNITDKLTQQILAVRALTGRKLLPDATLESRLISHLADKLASQGVTNLLHVARYQSPSLIFFYDSSTGKVLPQPFNYDPEGQGFSYRTLSEKSLHGQGPPYNMLYDWWQPDLGLHAIWTYIGFTPEKVPVFFAIDEKLQSEWAGWLQGILYVAASSIPLAFPALVGAIGGAVLGPEMAAAYPALANGIGQAAMTTALNGGDIKAGVVSAFTSGIASGAGSGVTALTDSANIGSIAAAATKAIITGGDPVKAAAFAALSNGGSIVARLGDSWGGDDTGTDFSTPAQIDHSDYAYGGDISTGYGPLPGFDVNDPFNNGGNPLIPAPGPSSGGTSPVVTTRTAGGPGLGDITAAALSALKIYTAFQQATNPSVFRGVTQLANGGSVTANANGTITTRQPTGAISTTRPPAGTAYVLSDGTTMTNNGDGTYSLVSASGLAQRLPYAAIGAGLGVAGMSPTLLAGLAVGAFLLLRR